MKIRFLCPVCECPAAVQSVVAAAVNWECAACDHRQVIQVPAAAPTVCAVCGNRELYKKKNFPHWLGLSILTFACVGFLTFMWRYEWGMAWAVLLGSAAVDGLLYLSVGDAIVCYRCGTQASGTTPGPEHQPFELTTHERYRQEKIRLEELKSRNHQV